MERNGWNFERPWFRTLSQADDGNTLNRILNVSLFNTLFLSVRVINFSELIIMTSLYLSLVPNQVHSLLYAHIPGLCLFFILIKKTPYRRNVPTEKSSS